MGWGKVAVLFANSIAAQLMPLRSNKALSNVLFLFLQVDVLVWIPQLSRLKIYYCVVIYHMSFPPPSQYSLYHHYYAVSVLARYKRQLAYRY